MRQKDMG
jgi:hypothetical protein